MKIFSDKSWVEALAGFLPASSRRILLLTSVFTFVSKECFGVDVTEDKEALGKFGEMMRLAKAHEVLVFPALVYDKVLRATNNKVLKTMSKDNCIMLDPNTCNKGKKAIESVCVERAVEFAEGILRGVSGKFIYARKEDVMKEIVNVIVNTDVFLGLITAKPVEIRCEKQWKLA